MAAKIGETVSAGGPEADLAIPALCSVLFEIVSNSQEPGFGRRAADCLRVVASLLEHHSGSKP